jgi:hypothetical protein
MIAETISLGILSLPSVLARIGLVPGLILIVGLGIIATYTGWVIGQFRMKYPWVSSDMFLVFSGKIAYDTPGRIFRRRRRDTLQALEDGRHRSRSFRRSTNNLSHLYHGQPHSHLDHLPEHRN